MYPASGIISIVRQGDFVVCLPQWVVKGDIPYKYFVTSIWRGCCSGAIHNMELPLPLY